ncbi:pyridine nucleotide-disulfide oxidoreductase [Streptomyces sp. A7024]|uniref:Pyridine nucleotide-disulfide oxidoreductase n=1 Tax=Streptomyces coryli TaxID=1128680 RepID=A0A6G4TWR0_9ACTN|nr:NAD(P)-binding protein [Streptomyces coryli]NGN64253.1 pyridine nucleotide-disulfide oxidoreductase [Streptomyces coryli]
MGRERNARQVGGGHGHGVVIGSSLAGLAAARALANFMDRVTVIERDPLPPGHAGRRRGVPQARHPHPLTAATQQGLEDLFPGIRQDLLRAGAVRIALPEDVLLLGQGGRPPRFGSGPPLLSAGRDLVDATVRNRLRADRTVSFLAGHEVVGLRPGPQDTVTGVWARARDRRAPDGWGRRRLIPADFVVDASGRESRSPEWAAELGYEPPAVTLHPGHGTHTAAEFAPPLGHVADWKALWLTGGPGDPGAAVLHPVEGGRWSVALRTPAGEPAPADHRELRAAAALRDPVLGDVLEAATPLGPVYRFSGTDSRWRHYGKLRRWPDQYLVVGDALATLDPAHGQGMTLAVQAANVLDAMLAAHGTAIGITYRLRRALAHELAPAWRTAIRRSRHEPRTAASHRLRSALGLQPLGSL